MSTMPPENDETDEIDALYRRANQMDSSRPDPGVERAVFSRAAEVAAKLNAKTGQAIRPRSMFAGWRAPLFGGLAAAAVAGLFITPRFFGSGASPDHAGASLAVQKQAPSVDLPTQSVPAPQAETYAPPRARLSATMTAQAPTPARPPQELSRNLPSAAAPRPGEPVAEKPEADASRATASRAVNIDADLYAAAKSGDVAHSAGLFEKKSGIDTQDSEGRTALMRAVIGGHRDAVNRLLARGADPNIIDSQGASPLQTAIAANYLEIAADLRRAGAH